MNKRLQDQSPQQAFAEKRAQKCAPDAHQSPSAYSEKPARPWVRNVAKALLALLILENAAVLSPAYAQSAPPDLPTTPHTSAPAGQRPIMDAANNGVPIVLIAPPSAGGVSRNQYEQFNVNPNGLILNNSSGNTQTQLGGWIAGNPQLGVTPARIILNEVVSGNPSHLRGTIEVAGHRADIVVANPNGITCNGCGFLNADRASLTTGAPQFGADGSLSGFDVRQGQLTVGGLGLNASNLEQLDLIARGLVIEGEIWAKNLNVIAGANQVLYGKLERVAQGGSGASPAFAIDIKDVGGMYANQIYLVATEQGLGVNSTGRMAALQGNLVLDVNGDLSLQDTYARQDIRITGTGKLELTGQTLSDGAIDASAGSMLHNRGAIDAQGRLTLAAGAIGNTGTIAQRNGAGATMTATGQLSNSGKLFSTGPLGITAGSIADTGGQLLSTGDLHLQAGQISLTGTRILTDGSARINATAGLNAQGANISAVAGIVATAGSAIANTGGTWQTPGGISLTAASVSNRSGSLLTNGRLDVNATGAIDNTGGNLLGVHDVRLNGLSLTNEGGQLVTDNNGTVTLNDALNNKSGLISAKGNLALNTGQGLIANTAGTIITDGGLEIAGGSLSNVDGVIAARARQNQALKIQAASIINHRGVIDAAAAMQMTATGNIDNAGGVLQSGTDASTTDGTAQVASESIANNGGRIVARGALTANTGTLDNNKSGIAQGIIASTAGSVNVTAAAITNAGGLITAAGDTGIRSKTFDNTAGELSSSAQLSVDSGIHTFINDGGNLLAGADVTVQAGTFRSNALAGGQASRIAASNDVVINAISFSNDGSSISAGRDIRIGTGSGLLSNQGGAIEAQRALAINAGAVDTRAGRLVANGLLSIQAASIQATDARITAGGGLSIDSGGTLVNARGVIASSNMVGITAAGLDNTDGTVSAGTSADVRLGTGLLDNTRGQLKGTQALILQSGEIRNVGGVIASGSTLAVDTQNRVLDNTGGRIVADGDLRIDSARFGNDGGTAASIGGKLTVDTHGGELSSNIGKLQAQGDVALTTGGFSNRGGLVSGSNIAAQTGSVDNDAGQIIAAGNLALTSQALNNHAGLLQAVGNAAIDAQGQALVNTASGSAGGIIAGGTLAIQAGSLDNKAGYVASNGSQTITVAGDIDNRAAGGQAGQILSNAGTSISAANLLNIGGSLSTLGNVSVNTALLDNRAGQVAASGDATLTAVTLDNSIDGGVGGSIDAGSLSVTGTTLNNNGGAMRSANDANYSIASFTNSGGTVSAKKVLTVAATSLANAGGSLVGDTSVTVTTSSQSPGGTIASANDVTLNINGNYSNSGLLSAQRNLTVNAANIINSGVLKAGDTLTANTGDLTNSGEISAHTTNLNVSSTLTNTAAGLIDGFNTNINAGITNNTGRIYGDVLRIKGNTVNNSGSGTIAARDTLVIGAQQVNNTNGALIYSLGNIAMAGSLDAGGNPIGEVQQLLNASSRIEAAGNIDMAVANLTNRNDALSTRIATSVEAINKTYIQPNGSVTKYDVAVLGWDPYYKENSGRYVLPSTTYPFAQYGATQMLLSNQSLCFDFGLDGAQPCPVVHNYPIGHQAWALFNVSPPNFSDLVVPVMPPTSLENFYGNCMVPDFETGIFAPITGGACGTYWAARSVYDQTVAQRTANAESLLDGQISSFNGDVVSRSFEVWNEYQITERSTSETVIDSTSPAQILAGGSITIAGSGAKLNDNSQIVAGGAINIGGASVINQAAEGTRSTTDSGQVRYRRIEHHGGFSDSYEVELHPWSPTTGAPYVETFQLPSYSYTPYAGNQTASRNLSVLTSAPSTASAAANLSAIGQNRIISAGAVTAVLPAGATVPAAGAAPLTIVRVDAAGSGAQARDVILSTLPRLTAPSNSLFKINPQPGARHLVETDPRFTNYRTFLSSDYMLQALNRDPERQLKRYGDGFYEQKLVNDQILALTGRRFLTGYSDTQAEYQALMDAGVAFVQQYQISPGVALSPEQMALLTTDIVWLTEQTVTLADGQTQQVLVPQVYLRRPRDADLQQSGSLIAGSDIRITSETDLVNSGTIAADRGTTLLAERDLLNQGGRISGQDIVARAGNDLKNLSGVIQGAGANSNVTLLAGRDIVLQTRTIATSTQTSATTAASSRVSVDRIATVQGGNVRLDAARDLIGTGSDVRSQNDLIATAGRNIKVSAVADSYQIDIQRGGNTEGRSAFIKEESITNQVATFAAGNNVTLVAGTGDVHLKGTDVTAGNNVIVQGANVTVEAVKDRQLIDVQNVRRHGYTRVMTDDEALAGGNLVAGNNLTVHATGAPITVQEGGGAIPAAGTGDVRLAGAYLSAKEGQATVVANNNVTLDTITTEYRAANESYNKTTGFLNKKTSEKSSLTADQFANGSTVIGNTVAIQSGQDVTIRGSTVLGSGDVVITAQEGNVAILAGESTSTESHFKQEKQSGLFGSKVGVGVTVSKNEQTSNFDGVLTTQSENRSVVGATGGNIIITAGKDTAIKGSDLIANKAKDDTQDATGHIDILAQNITIDPGQDTSRTNATAAAKHRGITVAVVGTMVDTARNLKDVQKKEGKFARYQGTVDEIMHSGVTSPQMTINFDRSQSSSQTTTNDLVNSGSTLIAAGDIRLRATGDGAKDAAGKATDGDIAVTGSTLNAGGLVQLDAQRDITLQPSTDQYRQSMQASSKSTHFSTSAPSIGDTGRAMTGGPNNSGVGQFPYSKTNTSDAADSAASVQSATMISGNDVVLNSRSGDIRIAGSGITAVRDIDVVAHLGKIDIVSGEDRRSHQEAHAGKTVGDLGQKGSTGTSSTVGVHKESSTLDSRETQQNTVRSALVAGRDLTLDARQDIRVQGADLRAGQDLTLIGQNIDLDPGQDTSLIRQTSAMHQAGSTIGASGYIVDAVKALEQAANAYEKKDDKRLAALYGAKAGLILYSNLQGVDTLPTDAIEAPKSSGGAAIKITVSVGSKSADSQSEVGSTANQGSTRGYSRF
ncbi:MAG: hypothetical protein A3I66_02515 [Burkholderiales bacterium RIFCSPLOWO2_02_FULL_57_36]|nr:MAG: hypothetical protein A3I66_02515 [Burkholderiales bacterium RIFCSPLOWO2_02_FULL_57_36]